MAEDLIRYDILAQDALRGVVRKVLSEVARTGLPGEHHFFISFATTAPGVRLSTRLLSQYPEEMTIVLQHQYWDLVVTEHALEVGLSFNGVPERLLIPFSAIKGFADPSVGFQLQFAVVAAPAAATEEVPAETKPLAAPAPVVALEKKAEATPKSVEKAEKKEQEEAEAHPAAQVVSLDAFRKK
ncbi:MAG TPA: ClpXP protease specificity-enhancing factor SspB [Bauldia sp.]|nr:ClpXP protease specificity-enhancing factor SspB [Bauldia sp.]